MPNRSNRLQHYSQSCRLLSYRPFLKNCQLECPPEVVPASSSHWLPMDTFVLHRNCTSWNHGTAGNREASLPWVGAPLGNPGPATAWDSFMFIPDVYATGSRSTLTQDYNWILQVFCLLPTVSKVAIQQFEEHIFNDWWIWNSPAKWR